MSRITTGVDVTGSVAPLQAALDKGAAAVQKAANKINRTKAELKVTANTDPAEKRIKALEKSWERQEKAHERMLARQARAEERAAAKRAAMPGELARRAASSSGADPFMNAVASAGPKAVGALIAAKVAGAGIEMASMQMDSNAAAARGDIAGEVEAEQAWASWKKGVPILGQVAAGIKNVISEDGRYIKNLEYQTKLQDKLIEQMAVRAQRTRQMNEQSDANLRDMDRQREDRTATPAGRRVLDAERALADLIERQDKERGQRWLESGQIAEREALGTAVGLARSDQRRERGASRVRANINASQLAEAEQAAATELMKEVEERRGARQRAKVASNQRVRAWREEQADIREAASSDLRSMNLRNRGLDFEADLEEAREQTRVEMKAAGPDAVLRRQAAERYEARSTGINRERREALLSGASDVRQAELRSQGKEGSADIEGIKETLRQELAAAGSDTEMADQARRRASASLRGMEREIDMRGRMGAEAVNAYTTDLTGRFSGSDQPAKETAEILKGDIKNLLAEIAKNTKGPSRMGA